jgi:cytochrome c-type biogenesis protein CcmE
MASDETKPAVPPASERPAEAPSAPRPATLFSPRVKLGVVFLLIAAGLTYFAWTAFGSATVSFAKVAEVATAGPTAPEKTVGVIGKLVEDSYVRSADGVTANFRLVDEGGSQQMQVKYQGEIGQVFFNDHSEIILQGRMGQDQVFVADTLTVRCPSKYLTEQERAEIEAQNNGEPLPPPYQPDYFQDKT